MRFTQSIHQARAGTHVTLSGEYMVRHAGQRTYCEQVKGRPQPFEAQSGRGDGMGMENDYQTLAQRVQRAQQAFSPTPDRDKDGTLI